MDENTMKKLFFIHTPSILHGALASVNSLWPNETTISVVIVLSKHDSNNCTSQG
jgi:hypothetical protein